MKKKNKRSYRNGQTRLMEVPIKYQENFLTKMDFRTEKYHFLDKEYQQLIQDLGGQDNLSTMEKTLAERLVFVSYLIRELEIEMANCENGSYAELSERWIKYSNTINSIISKLGISKRSSGESQLQKHLSEKYEQE